MSDTKLSAGALRAAGAIFAYMLPKDQLDDKVCYYLAEIIDRETGVAELLEAAKYVVDSFGERLLGEPLKRLEQAIAKIERGA